MRARRFAGLLEGRWESADGQRLTEDALTAQLEEIAQRAAAGKAPPEEATLLKQVNASRESDVPARLATLAGMCAQLRDIAAKELAGKVFSRQEKAFIKRYGRQLGELQLYANDAVLAPRDDLPVITPVFVAAQANPDRVLYAGVARPQAVYVIADVAGEPVLHRGAVLSYREFNRPLSQPLDDDAWRHLIRAAQAPRAPAFMASFQALATPADVIAVLRAGRTHEGIDDVPGPEITRELLAIAAAGRYPEETNDAPGESSWFSTRLTDHWVFNALASRATGEFVPDMLALVRKTDSVSCRDTLASWLEDAPLDNHRQAVMDLLQDPKEPIADVAVAILAAQPKLLDLQALLAGMPKRPEHVRLTYCRLLGKLSPKSPGAAAGVIAALEDPSENVRELAAKAAREYPPETNHALVQAMIRHVKDSSPKVAESVVSSLGDMKAQEAAPVLLRELAQAESRPGPAQPNDRYDAGMLRWRLIRALGDLAYAPAAGQLEKECGGRYWKAAAEALGQINRLKAIELVKPRLAEDEAGPEALEILGHLKDPDQGKRLARLVLDPKTSDKMRENAVSLLRNHHEDEKSRQAAIAALEQRVTRDQDVAAFKTLGKLDYHNHEARQQAMLRCGRERANLVIAVLEQLSEHCQGQADKADLMMRVLSNKACSPYAKAAALAILDVAPLPEEAVGLLVPLLTDETPMVSLERFTQTLIRDPEEEASRPAGPARVCDEAAYAIAQALWWKEAFRARSLTDKVRRWAQSRPASRAAAPAP